MKKYLSKLLILTLVMSSLTIGKFNNTAFAEELERITLFTDYSAGFEKRTDGIYAKGQNTQGQLGIGNNEDTDVFVKTNLPNDEIKYFKNYSSGFVVLYENGDMYVSVKENNLHDYGFVQNRDRYKFLKVDVPKIKKIISISGNLFISLDYESNLLAYGHRNNSKVAYCFGLTGKGYDFKREINVLDFEVKDMFFDGSLCILRDKNDKYYFGGKAQGSQTVTFPKEGLKSYQVIDKFFTLPSWDGLDIVEVNSMEYVLSYVKTSEGKYYGFGFNRNMAVEGSPQVICDPVELPYTDMFAYNYKDSEGNIYRNYNQEGIKLIIRKDQTYLSNLKLKDIYDKYEFCESTSRLYYIGRENDVGSRDNDIIYTPAKEFVIDKKINKFSCKYQLVFLSDDSNLYLVGKARGLTDKNNFCDYYDAPKKLFENVKDFEIKKGSSSCAYYYNIFFKDKTVVTIGRYENDIYDIYAPLERTDLIQELEPTITYNNNIFHESESNNGTICNSIDITITDGEFSGTTDEDFITSGKVEIKNLPEGLTASLLKISNSKLTFSIKGNAKNNLKMDSVSNLTLIFNNAAFSDIDVSNISGSQKNDFQILFNDSSKITYFTKEFLEADSNDGSIKTLSYASLHTNKFIDNVGDDLVALGKVKVTGCAEGLTVKVKLNSDNNATILLEGKAKHNLASDDVDNLILTFEDTAFVNQNDLNIIDKSMTFNIKFIDSPNIKYSNNVFKEDLQLNDGSIGNKIVANLYGDNFIGNDGDDLTSYITINNMPIGLELKAIKKDNTIELNLIEKADFHKNLDSIFNLEIKFNDTIFELNDSATIVNSTKVFEVKFEDEISIEGSTEKVKHAEQSQLYKDYKDALDIVNNLLDSSEKTSLLNRLSKLKNTIDSITSAEPLVDNAINSKDVVVYFKAKDAVDNLDNGDEKTRLTQKLENLRLELKASGKIKDGDTIFDHINQQPVTPPTPSTPPSSSGGETKIIYVEKKSSEEKKKEDEMNKARNDMLKDINSTVKDLSLKLESKDKTINDLLSKLKDSVTKSDFEKAQEQSKEMVEELKDQNQKLTDKIDELLKKSNFVVSKLPMDKIIGDANKNNSTVEIETIKYLIKVMDLSEEELKELKSTIYKLQKELEAVKNIHNIIVEKTTAISSKSSVSKPINKIGVTLYIDEKYYTENFTINDKLKVMDTKPFISIDDRTMVPIRFVSESLDAKVDWIPESNEAVIESKDGLKVSFTIGTDRMTINGIDAQADTATILKDNRTFVPVRLVSELFGYRVEWDSVLNRVKIKE